MRWMVMAAAALAAAGSTSAAEYTLFVYETPVDFAARSDPAKAAAYWAAYARFGEAAAAAGAMRGGTPVLPAAAGAAVGPIAAGPAAATLSGYFIVEAADVAAAMAWAKRLPAAATARVEVRPNLPASPAMAAR